MFLRLVVSWNGVWTITVCKKEDIRKATAATRLHAVKICITSNLDVAERGQYEVRLSPSALIPVCAFHPIIHSMVMILYSDSEIWPHLPLRSYLPVARVCHFCDGRGDFKRARKRPF